jgi:hypothetical protein
MEDDYELLAESRAQAQRKRFWCCNGDGCGCQGMTIEEAEAQLAEPEPEPEEEEMSDIVKRLRDPEQMKRWWDQYGMEAADKITQLQTALDHYQEIARNSTGVAGWHQNGDIATWDELGVER